MTTPRELGRELGVSDQAIRKLLRKLYGSPPSGRWELTHVQTAEVTESLTYGGPNRSSRSATEPRAAYVLRLVDELLGVVGERERRFDWLRGEVGRRGTRAYLPVDWFCSELGLVVEVNEEQHSEPVAFWDGKLGAGGRPRGELRPLYEKRRTVLIPQHGLSLIVIRLDELDSTARGALTRNRKHDLEVIRARFEDFGFRCR